MVRMMKWKIWSLIGIISVLAVSGCQVKQNGEAGKEEITSNHVDEKKDFASEQQSMIEEIQVATGFIELQPGESTKLEVTVIQQEDAVYQLQFKSSDDSICSVESDGTVKGISCGKVTITVEDEYSGISDRVVVWIKDSVPDTNTTEEENQEDSNDAGETTETGKEGSSANTNSTGNNENQKENTGNASTTAATTEATTESTTEATTEASAYYVDSYAEAVLAIVNEKRGEEGLDPLTMNNSLVSAAKVRAAETVQSFSHTRPDGRSCFTAFDEAGASYSGAGENIAAGQASATSVMDAWMNSQGHRDNIMNGDFTQIGIACYYDPNSVYGYYWVQCFIY